MWRLPLPVRLVDKDVVSKTRGRLEVFADGKWGTVCDDNSKDTGDQVSKINTAIGSFIGHYSFLYVLYRHCAIRLFKMSNGNGS